METYSKYCNKCNETLVIFNLDNIVLTNSILLKKADILISLFSNLMSVDVDI